MIQKTENFTKMEEEKKDVRTYETDCFEPIIVNREGNEIKEERCGICQSCQDEIYATIRYLNEYLLTRVGNKTVLMMSLNESENIEEEASKMYQKIKYKYKNVSYIQLKQVDIRIRKIYLMVYGIPYVQLFRLVQSNKKWRTVKLYNNDYKVMAKSKLTISFNQELKKEILYPDQTIELILNENLSFYIDNTASMMYVKIPQMAKELLYERKNYRALNKEIVINNLTLKRKNYNPQMRMNFEQDL